MERNSFGPFNAKYYVLISRSVRRCGADILIALLSTRICHFSLFRSLSYQVTHEESVQEIGNAYFESVSQPDISRHGIIGLDKRSYAADDGKDDAGEECLVP